MQKHFDWPPKLITRKTCKHQYPSVHHLFSVRFRSSMTVELSNEAEKLESSPKKMMETSMKANFCVMDIVSQQRWMGGTMTTTKSLILLDAGREIKEHWGFISFHSPSFYIQVNTLQPCKTSMSDFKRGCSGRWSVYRMTHQSVIPSSFQSLIILALISVMREDQDRDCAGMKLSLTYDLSKRGLQSLMNPGKPTASTVG